jgi:hypothetical protein
VTKLLAHELWHARRYPWSGMLVIAICTAVLVSGADRLVDGLRLGFVIGAASISYHTICVCLLYRRRYLQFRLGARRMIPPAGIYMAAASLELILLGISLGALQRLGEPGPWQPFVLFFLGTAAAHAYLVPLLAHQRAHSHDPREQAASARIKAQPIPAPPPGWGRGHGS